jgi:hypothetical protein
MSWYKFSIKCLKIVGKHSNFRTEFFFKYVLLFQKIQRMESTLQKEATLEQAIDLGLRADEFEQIKGILGRTPNFTETAVYSVMWSEHCSYKNSILWLKTLPKDGPHMLVKAGEENAGLVDIGVHPPGWRFERSGPKLGIVRVGRVSEGWK